MVSVTGAGESVSAALCASQSRKVESCEPLATNLELEGRKATPVTDSECPSSEASLRSTRRSQSLTSQPAPANPLDADTKA